MATGCSWQCTATREVIVCRDSLPVSDALTRSQAPPAYVRPREVHCSHEVSVTTEETIRLVRSTH